MELDILPLDLASDTHRPLVIAGPCSAETEEQVLNTAKALAQKGCRLFRAGVWKPRTKPGGFEGNGEVALKWLQQVKESTGMLVGTEVATPEHVKLCLKYGLDMLWIGARTTANPFAMQSLADSLQGVELPILVKNPVSPDLELWIGAMQRLNQAGIRRLAAIHRGFSSYDNKLYRNNPTWQIPLELRRRIPELPIICDPSHIGGKRELIAPLCQQAMDLGFDYFGSALTISPHKNSQTINSIGIDVQKIYTTHYLPSDFKKNQGYKRSVEMCEEYDIYRQCYCGCVYAAQAQNIDLVQVKKDATAFMLDKDVEKDYSHIKFTVTKLDI